MRSTRSFWLIRIRATVIGTTTITAPQTRLLRKLEREGVMGLWCWQQLSVPGILGRDRRLPRLIALLLRAL